MTAPNPRLNPDSPVEVLHAAAPFSTPAIRRRSAASMIRLDSGRILLTFILATGPERRDDGALMITHSDDGGRSWDEPRPFYAYPGWSSLPMGGLAHIADDLIHYVLGRIKLDLSLGGDEPFTDWYSAAITSRDGGDTWSEPGPEIHLFPFWTEMYGASNPHRLSDGRLLWSAGGTRGRDEGWHCGVTFSDPEGKTFSPPVVIAQAPDRNFSEIDLVRLTDGRFLAAIREHVTKVTHTAISADEGRTWTPPQMTNFKGSNVKLHRLRSGAILCFYRDEEPTQRGVAASVSDDGGASWRPIGHFYVADPATAHIPGGLCGYPDVVVTDGDELLMVLHTYPDAEGRVHLHLLRLRDRT